MINTQLELVYMSPCLPMSVIFDPLSNEIRICLLKTTESAEVNSEGGADVAMIEKDSRGMRQQLPQLIGSSNVVMLPVHTIDKCHRPENVLITQGLVKDDIIVCLYFQETKHVLVYTSKISKLDRVQQFKRIAVHQNIARMVGLEFS
jgi:hypothetical protein